jgi:hypothetical protein
MFKRKDDKDHRIMNYIEVAIMDWLRVDGSLGLRRVVVGIKLEKGTLRLRTTPACFCTLATKRLQNPAAPFDKI